MIGISASYGTHGQSVRDGSLTVDGIAIEGLADGEVREGAGRIHVEVQEGLGFPIEDAELFLFRPFSLPDLVK
jgi:hypothetical protein